MRVETARRALAALVGVGLTLNSGLATAQVPAARVPATTTQSDEIVVTAQRSGMPVWRVAGPRTTLVLVGTIAGVSKQTRWDPKPLTVALLKADRVMFPGSVQVAIGAFAAIGYLPKLIRFSTLPKGQTLQGILNPQQFARLAALQRRGALKPGFERKHPWVLAFALLRGAAGKGGFGKDAGQYVREVTKKNKIKLVPIPRIKAKPLANDLFGSRPQEHVACLMDAVALVEVGPGAVKARSDAWASRRVPETLASPAERMYHSCWPAGSALDGRDAALSGAVRGLMDQTPVTVAVVSLDALAERGGVLDDLVAAGFDVRGPRWR